MPLPFRLGKKPAVADDRVLSLSEGAMLLPDPPDSANWYADVEDWQMLGNDEVGDCVVAFGMHYIYQQMCYLNPGAVPIPTTEEAIKNYSAIGGYDPAIPATDQGLTVMGPGGMIEYWARTGLLCGGTVHKLNRVMQLTQVNPKEWRQAISLFSGVGIGMRMPQSIMDAPDIPFIWDDPTGPIAGYHEIFLVGYETVSNNVFYDCITWGTRVRLTEDFLTHVFDEGVVVLSTDGLDAMGKNAAGVDQTVLANSITQLQG